MDIEDAERIAYLIDHTEATLHAARVLNDNQRSRA